MFCSRGKGDVSRALYRAVFLSEVRRYQWQRQDRNENKPKNTKIFLKFKKNGTSWIAEI